MDIRKIKKLIELLEESGLSEIEIKEGEESIRLSRASAATSVAPAPVSLTPSLNPPAPQPVAAAEEPPIPEGHVIKSPMVGTFYAAPKPGAEPFVEIGSDVQAGDTLCVLEAMKIFNPIEADRAGTIAAILKENGDPVEYGETLFIIT